VSINATLIVQMIVFAILVWFTMRFIWPPLTAALDERAKKIAEGLSAADKAKADLAAAHQRVEVGLAHTLTPNLPAAFAISAACIICACSCCAAPGMTRLPRRATGRRSRWKKSAG
jgi:uncharacterized membrane protein